MTIGYLTEEQIAALPPEKQVAYRQWLKTVQGVQGSADGTSFNPPAKTAPFGGMAITADPSAITFDNQPGPTGEDPDQKAKIQQALGQISQFGAAAGSMFDAANAANPGSIDIGKSAMTGAATGAVAGAAAGPIGIIAGAAFGGIGSAIKAGTQKSNYDEIEYLKKKNKMNNRVDPVQFADGGSNVEAASPESPEEDPNELVPLQTNVGEKMIIPGGKIVDVMSKKHHKDMKPSEITDFAPKSGHVFSDDKKNEIDIEDMADDVIAYNPGRYSEEEGNDPFDKVTVGDIIAKKGKKTPAQWAAHIAKLYPITEKPVESIEIQTNVENKASRAMALEIIMKKAEGTYEGVEEMPVAMFNDGGAIRLKFPKKMNDGGSNSCGPGLVWDSISKRCVEPTTIMPIETEDGHVMAPINPVSAAEVAATTQFQIPPNQRRQVPGTPANKLVTPGWENEYRDPNYPGQTLPTLDPKQAPTSLQSLSPTTPNLMKIGDLVKDVTVQKPDPAAAPDMFGNVRKVLDDQRANNDADYNQGLDEANRIYRLQKLNNVGSLAVNTLGTIMQNPNVTPEYEEARFLKERFPEITETDIQRDLSRIKKSTRGLTNAIAQSGARGADIPSLISGTQSQLIEQEGEIRSKALASNKQANAGRYAELNRVINANNKSEVSAGNKTRTNINAQISNITDAVTGIIQAGGQLDARLMEKVQALRENRSTNANTITQSELDVFYREIERETQRADRAKTDAQIQETLKEIFK